MRIDHTLSALHKVTVAVSADATRTQPVDAAVQTAQYGGSARGYRCTTSRAADPPTQRAPTCAVLTAGVVVAARGAAAPVRGRRQVAPRVRHARERDCHSTQRGRQRPDPHPHPADAAGAVAGGFPGAAPRAPALRAAGRPALAAQLASSGAGRRAAA
eukprot:1509170-Rhodomonas_salina.1